jgi:Family of unknown function (DUF6256)
VTELAASAVRQAAIPMAVFYLIFMAALGLGLLRLHRRGPRHPADGTGRPAGAGSRPQDGLVSATGPPGGWLVLVRRVLGTAAGGYLLLVAVAAGYYYAITRVGGNFLASALTGPALLIVLATPVWAALSWLSRRAHGRGGTAPGNPGRPPRS